MKITRHGYINTESRAGSPTRVVLDTDQIRSVRRWVNANGNPTYLFRLAAGLYLLPEKGVLYLSAPDGTLLLVDDYGAMNDVHVPAVAVSRRKDLFLC